MNKEAEATDAELAHIVATYGQPRPAPGRRVFYLGASAGMAVGILNILATLYRWNLDNYFQVLDQPLGWLGEPGIKDFHFFPDQYIGPIGYRPSPNWKDPLALEMIIYWTVVGFLVASVIYLGRAGLIKEATRDKFFRPAISSGALLGAFAAVLNFLAMANGWRLLDFFAVLDRPVFSFVDAAKYRLLDIPLLPSSPDASVPFWLALVFSYWIFVGVFLASCICLVRAIKRRKHAIEPGSMISG